MSPSVHVASKMDSTLQLRIHPATVGSFCVGAWSSIAHVSSWFCCTRRLIRLSLVPIRVLGAAGESHSVTSRSCRPHAIPGALAPVPFSQLRFFLSLLIFDLSRSSRTRFAWLPPLSVNSRLICACVSVLYTSHEMDSALELRIHLQSAVHFVSWRDCPQHTSLRGSLAQNKQSCISPCHNR